MKKILFGFHIFRFLNSPTVYTGGGLNTIRDQLGPLLGITSSTTDESTGDQATGALDPCKCKAIVGET